MTHANRGTGIEMIWSAFSFYSHTPLIRVQGRLHANDYIDLLRQSLLPIYHNLLPNNGFYLHDNAPIHRARSVAEFLLENNITTLPWPPYSPDINCIENVWAKMKKDVGRLLLATEDELFLALQHSWNNHLNNPEQRQRYVDSMPRRLQAVHEARGLYIYVIY